MRRHNLPQPRLRRQGFTLIELMLIFMLVGVLMAIAIPSYDSYREKARVHEAAVKIAAMSVVIQGYFNDARSYPTSLADVKLDNAIDPWGRPYVYYNIDANGRGGARKDHALNPLNSDFDLYSMGKDGQTKSQITNKDSLDDVLRASDGRFVGLASDF